jgi:hypothetical protein
MMKIAMCRFQTFAEITDRAGANAEEFWLIPSSVMFGGRRRDA